MPTTVSKRRRTDARSRRPLRRRPLPLFDDRPLDERPSIQVIDVAPIAIVDPPLALPAYRGFTRQALVALLVVLMVGFSLIPIANHLFHPPGDNKDYDIWFKAGREVLEGQNLYSARELAGKRVFEFMYPPAAAVFLAPLTAFGKLPFLVFLDAINSLSWIVSLLLAVLLAEFACGGAGARATLATFVLPAVWTVAYVYDAYLLGQPNLMLLACLLAAFVALLSKKDWTAGALFAFATACKAFPALALGYLVYRRRWRAAGAMVVFLVLFTVVLPAPVRGVGRTVQELKTWVGGMLLHYDDTSIAQRPGTSYEWKNASLLATAHRLLRHVPAEHPDDVNPVYVNVADLDFHVVSGISFCVAIGLCLACVLLSPRYRMRTMATDAIELAMLLVLITVLSPISWFYYGVWLLYPFAVVTQTIAGLPKASATKHVAIGGLAVCLLLLNAVIPQLGTLRAVGWPFFGYLLLLIELGWCLRLARSRNHARLMAS
jgi:hypothetical protein